MPTYTYLCEKHGEFDEFHSISRKLEFCPQCEAEQVQTPVTRLITSTSKGVVERYGEELKEQTKKETEDLKKELYASESKYSNFVGEAKYEKMQKQIDYQKKYLR